MKYELLLLELLKLLKQTLPCRPRNRQLCKKKKIEISPFKWEKAAGRRPLRHVTLLLQCWSESSREERRFGRPPAPIRATLPRPRRFAFSPSSFLLPVFRCLGCPSPALKMPPEPGLRGRWGGRRRSRGGGGGHE